MISERRKFQRVYDLAERVLPADIDTSLPSEPEQARWAALRGFGNFGITDLGERRYWRADLKHIAECLQELIAEGTVTPVWVRGNNDGRPLYALTEALEATEGRSPSRRAHVLSPFDNLVIRRNWLSRFFGFDYTIECYVPEPKRVYGYFCLPLLWGDKFVGRLDAKADRKHKTFGVRRLTFEPDLPNEIGPMLDAMARKLADFAHFNGCERVRLYSIRPQEIRAPLKSALDRTLTDN